MRARLCVSLSCIVLASCCSSRQALLGARSPRCFLPYVVSVALVVPLGIFVGFVLPYIRQTFLSILLILIRLFASVARPIVDVMGPERHPAQLRHDGAARPGAGMGAGPVRRPGKQPRTLSLPSSLCRCRDLLFLGST